jgi:pimeloyl-ACP methyl ester carboxylesterase
VLRSIHSVLVLLLLATGACAADDGAPVLEPCQVPGVEGEVLCGQVTVFENRAAPQGRSIDLRIVVLPSRNRGAADPVYFLQGGPGAASSELAPSLSRSPIRDRHDLVLVDQRGTGGSNPLRCGPDDPLTGLEVIFTGKMGGDLRNCREHMDADLKYYISVEAMKDLDEVRATLGHERINLWGASYGSLEALEYVRRHPQRVRALAIQGVAPPALFTSLSVARTAQRALDATVKECRENDECNTAYPDVYGDLTAVLARLSAEPEEVSVHIPRTGEQTTLVVTRDLFAGVLRFLLYDERLADRIPSIVRDARDGDFDALAGLAVRFANLIGGSLYTGAVLSAFCSEDVDRFSEADIREASQATFLGPALALNLKRSCEGWPRGQIPADFHEHVSFEGPVLLLSGERDPVTPPSWADEASAHLPNSLHVVLPGAGHFIGPPDCVHGLLSRFFTAGTTEGLDTSCAE